MNNAKAIGSNITVASLTGAILSQAPYSVGKLLGKTVFWGSSTALGAVLVGGCVAIDYASIFVARAYVERNPAYTRNDRDVQSFACISKVLYTLVVTTTAVALGVLSIPTAAVIALIWCAAVIHIAREHPEEVQKIKIDPARDYSVKYTRVVPELTCIVRKLAGTHV